MSSSTRLGLAARCGWDSRAPASCQSEGAVPRDAPANEDHVIYDLRYSIYDLGDLAGGEEPKAEVTVVDAAKLIG